MRKYKVMLADDESEVIDTICRRIDWEAIGLEYPVCAHNGLEALELAEKEQPDIVMTDIKMPYINGLDLTEKLKSEFPNIRVIIFSGFDEFEYAQKAVNLDVDQFLLKPLDSRTLTDVFARIHDQLDQEYNQRMNQEMMEQYYLQTLPVLRENFFSSLIQGRISEDHYEDFLRDYRINMKGPSFCTAVLYTSTSHIPDGMNPILLTMSVRRLAEERISSSWDPHFFAYLGNTVLIVSVSSKADLTRFTDDMDRFCRLAKSVCSAVVTAGIGSLCSSWMDLPVSYTGARQAVSLRVLYGSGKAISISEVSPSGSTEENHEVSDNELQEVFKCIRLDDPVRLAKAIDELLNNTRFTSLQLHNLFTLDLIGELCIFARANDMDPNEVLGGDSQVNTADIQNKDREGLRAWMYETCLHMQEILQQRRQDNTRSFVDKAKDYVQENYADADLTITTLCSTLGVSAAYFSTVFKKETGTAFINYLTNYRMEIAARLLIDTDEKTYIIGQQVGYNDPNYFSYVFKKQYGVSPSKYRKNNES